MIEQVALQKGGEAGGMARRQIDVLIHVENRHFGPVDPVQLAQRFQEGKLRIAGGDDDVGRALCGDGRFDDLSRFLRRRPAHRLIGCVDGDRQRRLCRL